MKTYNLFVSHSWRYADTYNRLISLLRKRRYFAFKDYSVPPDDPIHNAGSDAKLRAAIQRQISPCHVILVPAGIYATYSKWINIEIDLATNGFANPKPIIAITPWGSNRVSVPATEAADATVGWNTESIVAAIRSLA